MIGTRLVEELVQSVALSHRIKGQSRVSLLILAAPESGKTTIASAANAKHVRRVAVISGRSVLREVKDNRDTEFLLLNDLTAVRAMSAPAVNLLINLLNQLTQDERGIVAFAGGEVEQIERPIGIIGCMPFSTFSDHRARWRELGFVSRMIPFAYAYPDELIAEIKDTIDRGEHAKHKTPIRKLKPVNKQVNVQASTLLVEEVRRIADARAKQLGQLGIRLLTNYHCLVRAHALLEGRKIVKKDDVMFLREVDSYVSITECRALSRN